MIQPNIATANAVVIANAFNVSIFNQIWFLKNEIFTEEELVSSESIFLPVVTQVGTSDCHLLIVPERLQMTLKFPETDGSPLGKITKIISILPETPYIALGINIIWELTLDNEMGIGDFTRRNFTVPGHRLYEQFSVPDARFGTYLSKNFDDLRMKLDIKPVNTISSDVRSEKVQMNFNFHLDLPSDENKVQIIRDNLTKWTKIFEEAEKIAKIFSRSE